MMKAGDKIRVFMEYGDTMDFTVEEFRYSLGIFQSDNDRKACNFTPLCHLYEKGPDSKSDYIGNYGSYYTNHVQAWMDIPKD